MWAPVWLGRKPCWRNMILTGFTLEYHCVCEHARWRLPSLQSDAHSLRQGSLSWRHLPRLFQIFLWVVYCDCGRQSLQWFDNMHTQTNQQQKKGPILEMLQSLLKYRVIVTFMIDSLTKVGRHKRCWVIMRISPREWNKISPRPDRKDKKKKKHISPSLNHYDPEALWSRWRWIFMSSL